MPFDWELCSFVVELFQYRITLQTVLAPYLDFCFSKTAACDVVHLWLSLHDMGIWEVDFVYLVWVDVFRQVVQLNVDQLDVLLRQWHHFGHFNGHAWRPLRLVLLNYLRSMQIRSLTLTGFVLGCRCSCGGLWIKDWPILAVGLLEVLHSWLFRLLNYLWFLCLYPSGTVLLVEIVEEVSFVVVADSSEVLLLLEVIGRASFFFCLQLV